MAPAARARNPQAKLMAQEPSRNETIKQASRALRGTLQEGLDEIASGAISEDDQQLVKFHGMYLQDDRDLRPERAKRKLDRAYAFMARLRIPAGLLSREQYLAMDRLADDRANGTLRLTTRQTIQFHGIIKSNVRAALREVNAAMLNSIAACGDINRNVMATSNPYRSAVHRAAFETARAISDHLLPKSRAWYEIFIDDEKVAGGEPEDEPIYGQTYLPRKFKITIAVPPDNDVDAFAHDLSFIALAEAGRLVGYTVVAGGGMGATHGDPETHPAIAQAIGYCPADQAVAVAEAVVGVQRDFGNRAVRKRARLKYTIEDRGLDWFIAEVNRRLATPLQPARPFHFTGNGDATGWTSDTDGRHHLTLFVENGRIADRGDWRLKSALRTIAQTTAGDFVFTPNQNVILANLTDDEKPRVQEILASHGVVQGFSILRENAMACVALPTCGLALAESERYLPSLITRLERIFAENGLADQRVTVRMTGCPNGCARPYLAEIGFVGRNPGRYNLHLGGAADGTRLNRLYREDLDEADLLTVLGKLIADYAMKRGPAESFGDFVTRTGVI